MGGHWNASLKLEYLINKFDLSQNDYYFSTFLQISDLANEDTPQLFTACGRGPRSSMVVLRHGLEVSKIYFMCINIFYISI